MESPILITSVIVNIVLFILVIALLSANFIVRLRVTRFREKFFSYIERNSMSSTKSEIVHNTYELIRNELPDSLR